MGQRSPHRVTGGRANRHWYGRAAVLHCVEQRSRTETDRLGDEVFLRLEIVMHLPVVHASDGGDLLRCHLGRRTLGEQLVRGEHEALLHGFTPTGSFVFGRRADRSDVGFSDRLASWQVVIDETEGAGRHLFADGRDVGVELAKRGLDDVAQDPPAALHRHRCGHVGHDVGVGRFGARVDGPPLGECADNGGGVERRLTPVAGGGQVRKRAPGGRTNLGLDRQRKPVAVGQARLVVVRVAILNRGGNKVVFRPEIVVDLPVVDASKVGNLLRGHLGWGSVSQQLCRCTHELRPHSLPAAVGFLDVAHYVDRRPGNASRQFHAGHQPVETPVAPLSHVDTMVLTGDGDRRGDLALNSVVLRNLSGVQDVRKVERLLESGKSELLVDLTEVKKIETAWLEAFSNILLTASPGRPMEVALPSDRMLVDALERGGLFFALGQRRNPAVLIHQDFERRRSVWEKSWDPGSQEVQQELAIDEGNRVPLEQSIRPDLTASGLAAVFVNPHARARDDQLVDELGRKEAEPWIAEWLVKIGKGLESLERDLLAARISRILREMVSNLDHAFRPVTGLYGSVPQRRKKSYVQVYCTTGQTNRLHLVVGDTGLGIVRTLRPKLMAVDSRYDLDDGIKSDSDIVQELLAGKLPNFGQASGLGYSMIRSVASDLGGKVHVVTGSVDNDNVRTSVIGRVSNAGTSGAESMPEMSVSGTVIHAILPIG